MEEEEIEDLKEKILRIEEELLEIKHDIFITERDIENIRTVIARDCEELEACDEVILHIINGISTCPIEAICEKCKIRKECFFYKTYEAQSTVRTKNNLSAFRLHIKILDTWHDLIRTIDNLRVLKKLYVGRNNYIAHLKTQLLAKGDDI